MYLMSDGRMKGISLVAVDRSIPLTDQGPFDVLLHKVSGLVNHRRVSCDMETKYQFVVSR